jgi:hypothetical protein
MIKVNILVTLIKATAVSAWIVLLSAATLAATEAKAAEALNDGELIARMAGMEPMRSFSPMEPSYSATPDEGMLQVTSVSQLTDVRPTGWAFQALQSLVERYGCIVGYPDKTFCGN